MADRSQTSNLANDSGYQKYLSKLTQLGFFQGELSGSLSHMRLSKVAEDRYLAMQDRYVPYSGHKTCSATCRNAATRPTFAQSVSKILSTKKTDDITQPADLQEDSENWMTLEPAALDSFLEAKQGSSGMDVDGDASDEDAAAERQAEQLGGFADKLEGFLKGKGSLQGALFDESVTLSYCQHGLTESTSEDLSDDEEDSDEDPTMTADEKQQAMDKLVPTLPDSEWGEANVPPAEVKTDTTEQVQLPEPKLEGEKYDGVSDDESEDGGGGQIEELEDEDPQVEGEEVDMDQEMNDFLNFTREALGLSQEQYDDILRSRSDRGGPFGLRS
jgi:hypothetical protein